MAVPSVAPSFHHSFINLQSSPRQNFVQNNHGKMYIFILSGHPRFSVAMSVALVTVSACLRLILLSIVGGGYVFGGHGHGHGHGQHFLNIDHHPHFGAQHHILELFGPRLPEFWGERREQSGRGGGGGGGDDGSVTGYDWQTEKGRIISIPTVLPSRRRTRESTIHHCAKLSPAEVRRCILLHQKYVDFICKLVAKRAYPRRNLLSSRRCRTREPTIIYRSKLLPVEVRRHILMYAKRASPQYKSYSHEKTPYQPTGSTPLMLLHNQTYTYRTLVDINNAG